MKLRKKLIEVALPLDIINHASVRENYIYRGNPSSLHKWWAQRPLAAARAIIFAQMVDDPSSRPERFPTEASQEIERRRLFSIIEDLVLWDSITNELVLSRANEEIRRSWRDTCTENEGCLEKGVSFDPTRLPLFHDPFAGGGTLPLEAQRLGFEVHASDLNPVSVIINKALLQVPPRFARRPAVNPDSQSFLTKEWRAADGLAADLRYYGELMHKEAEKQIGDLYPKVEVTQEMARKRPDLKSIIGHKLPVLGWLWTRTIKSPDPAFANVDVPLASTFLLSSKPGREVYIVPVIEEKSYLLEVRVGGLTNREAVQAGTKLAGANFQCLLSQAPITANYIQQEGRARRLGAQMMAVVVESD